MTTQIALVTYQKSPALNESDQLLVEPLQDLGVEAEAVAWDDPAVVWRNYEAIILRSCWDYHLRSTEFHAWITRMEQSRVPLWNVPQVVRWNMDKRYLRELAQCSVPILPTQWVEKGRDVRLETLLQKQGWGRAVVKPCIGASADGAWVTTLAEAGGQQEQFAAMVATQTVMVQPFMTEIEQGEWSLVFFEGHFSHAALRWPVLGADLALKNFGADADQARAPAYLIDQASYALETGMELAGLAGQMPLYARVDGLNLDRQLTLMELELIEPDLFLDYDPAAPQRFAAAIRAKL